MSRIRKIRPSRPDFYRLEKGRRNIYCDSPIFTWQADGKFSIMHHVLFAVIEWMTQEVYTYGDQITSDQRYDKRGTGE